jgi:hypothetical protein
MFYDHELTEIIRPDNEAAYPLEAKAHFEKSGYLNLKNLIESIKEKLPDRSKDRNIKEIQRFYGLINIKGESYKAKITIKVIINPNSNNAYSYEVSEIK